MPRTGQPAVITASAEGGIRYGSRNDDGVVSDSRSACESLVPALAGRRLHGADRKPPVRLDAVRQSDEQGAWLEPRRDPGRLRDLHRHRNLADADPGLD